MTAKVVVECKTCRMPFTARVADRKRGWGQYCSKSCKAIKQTQKTGYAGPGRHGEGESEPFRMSAVDLAAGGYGDSGPDDPFGSGKY